MADPQYVGTTQGDFSVEAGGSAAFSIPIQVPPGTARMQPSLSLDYLSGAGSADSLIGNGWNLRGLSHITRCAATVAQDGYTGTVRFDDGDRFVLDGGRLQPVQGAYGAPDAVYHTEIESWRKVVPVYEAPTPGRSGPDGFRVFERDGRILEYGGTPDARLAASPDDPTIRVWALSRVTDRLGNALVVTYKQDAANGACYPDRIAYTSHPALQARRAVTFAYEPRPDVMPRYVGGVRIAYAQRLAAVSTWLDDQAVRTYSLAYATGAATGRSQLVSVTEADGQGKALPPLTFTWQDGNAGIFADAQPLPSVSVTAGGQLLPMDVNGDGLVDMVYVAESATGALTLTLFVNQGTTFSDPVTLQVPQLTFQDGIALPMDVNADGCIELVYGASDGYDLGLTIFAAVADPASPGGWKLAVTGTVNGAGPEGLVFGGQLLPMDVNGDGLVDLVYASSPDGMRIQLQELLSTGTAFTLGPCTVSNQAPGGSFIPMDFNGDGLCDVVYAFPDAASNVQTVLFLSTWGQGLQEQDAPPLATPLPLTGGGSFVPFDVNGDGLGDLVYATQDAFDQSLLLYTLASNGKSFELQNGGQPQKFPLAYGGTLLPMDVDGDGVCELVVVSGDASVRLDVLAFDGGAYQLQSGVYQALAGLTGGGGLLPLDLAGKGKTGLVYAAGSTTLRLTCAPPAGPYPDLVVAITNGLQGVVSMDYKPLTDRTVYRRSEATPSRVDAVGVLTGHVPDSTCVLDPAGGLQAASAGTARATRSVDFPKYVVASHTLDEGAGTRYDFQRFYTGALLDLRGRGWLGYAAIHELDVDAGAATYTEYGQDFPLTGMALRKNILTADGVQLVSTVNTYDSRAPAPWPGVPVAAVQLAQAATSYFSPGQPTPDRSESQSLRYDDYGNRTVLAETGSGLPAPLYTLDDYSNDAGTWLLGLHTQSRRCADAGGATVLSAERCTYDPNGQRLSKSEWHDVGDTWLATTYAYDAHGNPIAETDPSGATTSFAFDPDYQTFVVQTLQPANDGGLRLASKNTFDARFGVRTSATDANGVKSAMVFDGLGRQTELQGPDPAGALVSLATYAWIVVDGQAYAETRKRADWAGEQWLWTRERLDGFGRKVDSLAPGPEGSRTVRVDRTLDSRNQCASETLPYFDGDAPATITRELDALGRVVRVQRPAEGGPATTTITWTATDTAVQVEAAGTPLARKTVFTFGGFGGKQWIVSRTGPDGGVTTYAYDALRRLVGITDPGGVVSARTYDALGRIVQTTQSRGAKVYQSATHVFDDVHRAVRSSDAAGDTVTVKRDALHRVVLQAASSPAGDYETAYAYDSAEGYGLGRLASVADSRGSYAYAYGYDACGNETMTTLSLEGRSYTTRRAYLPDQRLAQVVMPDGAVQQNDWFAGGAWAAASLLDAGALTAGVSWSGYTAFGSASSAASTNDCKEATSYDALGQLVAQRIAAPDGRAVVDDTYARDTLDQLLAITDASGAGQSRAFTYDAAGRLAGATGPFPQQAYAYDAAGNMVRKGDVDFSYDGQQVVQGTVAGQPVFSATYDANGRTTQRTWQGTASSCTFDAENRLLAAGDHSFVYDHAGRRLVKRAPGHTTFYVSENFERTEFADGAAQRTRRVVGPYGIAVASTIVEAGAPPPTAGVPAPGTFYLHSDHVNSTTVLTDAAGGVAARAIYMPYGEVVAVSGTDAFRHKFTGKELDATGLYYFQSRYYDPVTGRFTSADDRAGGGLFATDALNMYAYVGNNPVSRIDPSGHSWQDMVAQMFISTVAVAVGAFVTPFSGAVGGMLVGAGIGGLVYDVTEIAHGRGNEQDHNQWGGWAAQFGVGAATGLVTGGIGRFFSRVLSELPAPENVGWDSTWFSARWARAAWAQDARAAIAGWSWGGRVALAGGMGAVNGAVGGVLMQVMQNGVTHKSAEHGLGMAALIGGIFGGIGGSVSRGVLEKYGVRPPPAAIDFDAPPRARANGMVLGDARRYLPTNAPLMSPDAMVAGMKMASGKIWVAAGRGIMWGCNDDLPW
ncbi:hypothetical protein H8N03_00480 [Ramlibacter sp. USB13]|uniref:Teneurin-like YD-shell domain-containing protein n=1 Tax=Ramlibacter cellulosilyticus TaxID=2764187 RepID=A0A923MLU4_9BURK|nr:RHS repeat-associated core domain-containing protein [Ramlibacter cellulosilyticus]MBC5781395.1 hypothetical protein [Ramlibacter cellulosilyticus]